MRDPDAPKVSLFEDWKRAALAGDSEADLDTKIESQRQRVSRMKDPFMPIAVHDAAARAKERVLWEDDDTMVIVDAFSMGPKALVVPKTEMLFPSDASEDYMQRLAHVASAVSDVFMKLGATAPAKCWINPPSALTVRQLHVHVQPSIARPSNKNALWDDVTASLAEHLADSAPRAAPNFSPNSAPNKAPSKIGDPS